MSFSRDIYKSMNPPGSFTAPGVPGATSCSEDTQIWNHTCRSKGFTTPELSTTKVSNSESEAFNNNPPKSVCRYTTPSSPTWKACNTPTLKQMVKHGCRFPGMQSRLINVSDHGQIVQLQLYTISASTLASM